MPKRLKTSQEVGQKWQDNLASAGDRITAGVQAVQENPMKAAKAKKKTMQARLAEALKDGGKYDQVMDASNTEDWRGPMLTKGVTRATQGAADGRPKVDKFLDQFLPFAHQVSVEVGKMPNATEGERDARMLSAVKKLRGFKRARR